MLVVSIMVLFLSSQRGCNETHYAIHENTQILVQPAQLWGGFIKREWQPFLEQRFLRYIGYVLDTARWAAHRSVCCGIGQRFGIG